MAGRTYETAIKISASLASTFRSVTGGATAALKGLTAQAAKLSQQERGTEKFAALTLKVAEAERKWKDSVGKGADAYDKAERELIKVQNAAIKAGVALVAAGVDTRKLSQEQHRLATELAATERKMAGLAALQKGWGLLKAGGAGLGGNLRSLAGDAARVGAAGLGASVGLFALLKRAAEAGDAIDDVSGRLGISGEALQSFHMQAKLAGGSAEDADVAIGKLAVNIGKVMAARKKGGGGGGFGPVEGLTVFGGGGGGGGDAAQDPFKRLGLSAKALSKMAPEKQVEAIADKISGLKTQAEKAAAAVAVFGKGALKFLPALSGGAAGIRQLREEGVATGQFMSDEATKAASDFNDALEQLTNQGVNSVVNALGGTLLPVGTKTFKDLTKWVREHQAEIKAWAETTKKWIETKAVPAVMSAASWFYTTGQRVFTLAERVANLVGGFGNLVVILGLLRLAPLVVSIGQIAVGVYKLAAGIATLTGATWAGAAAWAAWAAPLLALAAAGVVIGGSLAELFTDDKSAILQKNAEIDAEAERRRKADLELRGGAGGQVLHFAPQITMPPGMKAAELDPVFKRASDDLEQRQKRLAAEQRRLAYE